MLGRGSDKSGSRWFGEGHPDGVGIKVLNHLAQETGVETDFHWIAAVFALDAFSALVREIHVLGRQIETGLRQRETDLEGGLAGIVAQTADGFKNSSRPMVSTFGFSFGITDS